jgi:hypothetical protein
LNQPPLIFGWVGGGWAQFLARRRARKGEGGLGKIAVLGSELLVAFCRVFASAREPMATFFKMKQSSQ